MRSKALLIIVLAVGLTATGVATSFGTFVTKDSDRLDGGQGDYTLKMMNLGDQAMDIEIEPYNVPDDVTVRVESGSGDFRSFRLEPSKVTSNPSGDDNWFVLRNGDYAKVKQIDISAIKSGSNNDGGEFDVRIRASSSQDETSTGGDETEPVQNVVQVRSHTFEMVPVNANSEYRESEEPDSSQETLQADSLFQSVSNTVNNIITGSSDSTQEDNSGDPEVRVTGGEEQQQETSDDNIREETGIEEQKDMEKNETSADQVTGNFFAQTNSLTPVMIIAALGSVLYLMRVM